VTGNTDQGDHQHLEPEDLTVLCCPTGERAALGDGVAMQSANKTSGHG